MQTKKRDFIKVPWAFWKSVARKMDYIEGYIFLYMAQYCYGAKDICWPTQLTISIDTGIPLVTVKRKLESMEIRKVVEVISTKREGKAKWNTYKLTDWYKISDLDDWYKVEKKKDKKVRGIDSNDTLQGIPMSHRKVSGRAIKKNNSRRVIQEDKFAAVAANSSDSMVTTATAVSSGNRGEAPRCESDTKDNQTQHENFPPVAQTAKSYDELMSDNEFRSRLARGALSDLEYDLYVIALEEKEAKEKTAAQMAIAKAKASLTIEELIERDANPKIIAIAVTSTERQIKDEIWRHFRNRGDSIKYRNKLYAMAIGNGHLYDPIDNREMTEKEVLIQATAYLKDYWNQETWFGDGSLMMFIANHQKFYNAVSVLRWNVLNDYCEKNGRMLARKCVKENRLVSIEKNKEAVKEILESGIELSETLREYLQSDPAELKYNAVACLLYNGNGVSGIVRINERDEISLANVKRIYESVKTMKNAVSEVKVGC